MFTIKCPFCSSSEVKKNGVRNGSQFYKCKSCHKQFIYAQHRLSSGEIWKEYLDGKQTLAELAISHQISISTIQRKLHQQCFSWEQPELWGYSGFVHIDATYWGHNWGVLLAIDEATGKVLYMSFIKHETTMDYRVAIEEIMLAGYHIRGIIIDGKQELFGILTMFPVQMCQFHMLQIVRRYLTKHPKMIASRELLSLCEAMIYLDKEDWINEYSKWKDCWKDFLNKRTVHKNGKTYYLHRRLRTLVSSINFYLPYLFTYQLPECDGMPNTNNKIEGTFTDLKKNLNNHSGLSLEHRRQFIIAYLQTRNNES